MPDFKEIYRPRSFLKTRETAGQTAAVDEQEGKIYEFNGSAALIWRSLDGKTTLRGIAAKLAQEYGRPVKQIETDAAAFIKYLIENDLIENVELC